MSELASIASQGALRLLLAQVLIFVPDVFLYLSLSAVHWAAELPGAERSVPQSLASPQRIRLWVL